MTRLSARWLLPLFGATLYACAFDWDGLDPRVDPASSGIGGAATGAPSNGGAGGDGAGVPDCDPADCPQPSGECEAATCSGGVCGVGPAPDGTPCTEDGVFCNGAEVCQSGACVSPGDPCPIGDDDDCFEGCDEATDSCTALEPKDTPCDDGLFCNGIDQCNPQGFCSQHIDPPCPGVGDADCTGACDEDNDDCGLPEPDGSPCDDGSFCNGTDSCSAGVCASHTGNPCPGADGDSDCSESCNESNDSCTANDPDGSECNGIVDNICCSSGQCTTSSGC